MNDFFSSIPVALASFAAIVAATDFFLTDAHKCSLSRYSVLLWYRLAEINLWKKLHIYKSEEFHRGVFVYGPPTGVLLLTLFYTPQTYLEFGMVGTLSGLAAGGVIAALYWGFYLHLYSLDSVRERSWKIHSWVLRGDSVILIFLRSTALLFGILLILLVSEAIQAAIAFSGTFFVVVWVLLSTAIFAPFLVGFGIVDMLFFRIIVLAVIALPLLVLEYLARRIAEYSKGVVLAFAALLGSAGILLNGFLSWF